MALITVLIPVDDDAEKLEWLASFGLRPRARALRYPTLGELRAAARSTHPARIDEQQGHDRWSAHLLYGPVETGSNGRPFHAGGGFELNADVGRHDDDAVTTSVGFRGGGAGIDHIARAIAAAVGPVMVVDASSGEPRLFEGP